MKIGFLITARLKSERLPKKVIKDLNGKKVIERIIDRAKEVDGIDKIIICTSKNPQDSPLVDIAIKNNINYFKGDEDDVLKRLCDASIENKFDYITGITADNPLFSIRLTNKIIRTINEKKPDFVYYENLPIGVGTFGMSVKALKTVIKIKNVIDTEIWGPLIKRPDIFNIVILKEEGKLNRPDLRFTLDYKEDYDFLSHIYKNIKFDRVIRLYDVIEYLNDNPKVVEINKNCIQRKIDSEILDKIKTNFNKKYNEIIKIKDSIYKT